MPGLSVTKLKQSNCSRNDPHLACSEQPCLQALQLICTIRVTARCRHDLNSWTSTSKCFEAPLDPGISGVVESRVSPQEEAHPIEQHLIMPTDVCRDDYL